MKTTPVNASASGSSAAARPLDDVLDDHAELRDVLVQLRGAEDLSILSGLLQRLHDLLQGHFAREEADPGMCEAFAGAAVSGRRVATRLGDEHGALLAALGDLIERVEASEEASIASFEPSVAAVLEHLHEHDALETELLGASIDANARAPSSQEISSEALEVNLRRTAVDVVIPAEHAVLLEIIAAQYGIHESTRKLLREINHRYVGWPQTLEELHRRAMGDLARYLAHQRAADAIGVFFSLYAKAAEQSEPASLRETAVRQWFYYLEKVVGESGEVLPSLLPVIKRALSRLGAIFEDQPQLAVVSSPRIRRFAQKLQPLALDDPGREVAERALELLVSALRQVYAPWRAQPDPADWWRESTGDSSAALPDALAPISRTRFEQNLERLDRLVSGSESLVSHSAEVLGLPDSAQIGRAYLDAAACVESEAKEPWQNQIARIRWLIRVLSSEALAGAHERALSEIHRAYRDALRGGGDRAGLEQLVRETFVGLRRSHLSTSPGALSLISKIGVLVFASGDRQLAQVVVEEILDWDFPRPGFAGFTDEWQVRVDPAHLRAIRALLAVIEEDPEQARPLIAALVVHLKLGGVFVADTDLFQKDVSKLLNSGIGPVYHPVKQLLKLFPVYFRDIGAEGELREVSSRIDEITGRKDPLCHFLRKQCHVESNPQLIGFIDAIAGFWATGDRTPLQPFVSPALYDRLDVGSAEYRDLHRIFSQLLGPASVLELDSSAFDRRLTEIQDARPVDVEKARLLLRLRTLLCSKYQFGSDDLLARIGTLPQADEGELEELRESLAEQHHERTLTLLLALLERLKRTITSEERTEGFEDIYRKRHIAVGIPSLYGRYREEKFEALGVSFHIEAAASAIFERMISEENLEYVTRDGLRKTARWLRMLLRAVRIDGCQGRGLATGLSMLEQALDTGQISVDQYVNIFQIISRSVEQLIRIRFIQVYQDVLDRVLRRTLECGGVGEEQEEILKASEGFLRDLIAQGFGLQPLDRLVAKTLRTLVQARESFDRNTLNLLMSFDVDRCFAPIEAEQTPFDGVVLLGNKGYQIKRLALEGLPVPPGFVLTTELFRCWPAIRACDELRAELRERIGAQIAQLEQQTGSRFGDPKCPLLLSVRSSAAVSMPGMLDTFLNVGISEQIAEGLGARSGSSWGAWDAYRRFIQFWGMGHDIARDRFDELMRSVKAELGVAKKAEIPSEVMKEVAFRYRRFVEEQGVEIAEDPAEQLERCVELVLQSWDAEKAREYRGELQIAENWGTAVVVQSMVYGNLNDRSGTGVVLTCNPQDASGDLSIHGDFIVQGQGDDVVSGLVETFPISEEQRRAEWAGETRSLERDFPRIYRALLAHASVLILDHGMFHQEIEFTFENDDPDDLYILQTRDSVMAAASSVCAFVPGPALERARLATGIGAGGGALCGRIALTPEDIESLRRRFPDDPVILLRPDTVPDDIPLILRADGVVTSLGGATSHAALVAQQLGRTCVVGCRQLRIDEVRGRSQLGEHTLCTGEFISISGIDGSVYLGEHPSTKVRRRQLA